MHSRSSEECVGSEVEVAPVAAGVKPVPFWLCPLDLSAQALLFLKRAPRPLHKFEVWGSEHQSASADSLRILQPNNLRFADLMALAKGPMLRDLGGSPGQIVVAAQQLSNHVHRSAQSG